MYITSTIENRQMIQNVSYVKVLFMDYCVQLLEFLIKNHRSYLDYKKANNTIGFQTAALTIPRRGGQWKHFFKNTGKEFREVIRKLNVSGAETVHMPNVYIQIPN